MAEAIGIASGILTLVSFAFKSSVALSTTIQSFQTHPKRVRDLLTELESLTGVLSSLGETLEATTDVDLSAIKLPLLQCGKACSVFKEELIKCSSRSGGGRTSFRDWAKLRYLGDDIDGFRQALAGYGATICVALADVNIRKSSVTAGAVERYKELIKTATDDLEARLESIDERLETLLTRSAGSSADAQVDELRRIKQERLSTRQCLDICSKLGDYIDTIQIKAMDSERSPVTGGAGDFPETVFNDGLQECKKNLATTAEKLQNHLQELVNRLVERSGHGISEQEDAIDIKRLQDELATTLQCQQICAKADDHLKENISQVDNYATGDAVQFMVSTNNKIIHGSNRGLGWRTRQVGGHLSDASLQQLSRDMAGYGWRGSVEEEATPDRVDALLREEVVEDKNTPEFKERYGSGFRLDSQPDSSPGAGATDGLRGSTFEASARRA